MNGKKNKNEDFEILRKIAKNPNFSQRELSKELGYSLGKLNYCLKELQKKGLIKIKNFKKNKKKINYIYILTPQMRSCASSNANPSTASDVRSWPISNNSGRCSERHTGSHSKNRDKFTPWKPTRNPKRRNMMINISGYIELNKIVRLYLTIY
mgnify:CR=1 FL=1